MPNKLLGQHFLRNLSVAQKIVAAVDPRKGDVIVEIGPGNGELTRPLAKACVEKGCTVTAIEKDALLAERLSETLGKEGLKNVTIATGDVLELLTPRSPFIEGLTGKKVKIVGNIPYYLTGHLLRIVGELTKRPDRCVFMVQEEVAERIMAAPPRMNRLAASICFWANPSLVCRVPKEDFFPKPKVDSAVISLERKDENAGIDADHYYAAVRALFAQPRKTILNNIAAAGDRKKEVVASMLTEIGLDPNLRPQNLSITSVIRVAESFWG